MNNLFIIGGTLLGVTVIYGIVTYLFYKKVDIPNLLSDIKNFLSGAKTITDVLEDESVGKAKKVLSISEAIETIALKCVNGVSQKYVSGQTTKEDRKNEALKGINGILEYCGIKVTDNLEKGIELYLESVCGDDATKTLDKKIDEAVNIVTEKAKVINTSLQKQVDDLTSKNSLLTQANLKLSQDNLTKDTKINEINSTLNS